MYTWLKEKYVKYSTFYFIEIHTRNRKRLLKCHFGANRNNHMQYLKSKDYELLAIFVVQFRAVSELWNNLQHLYS